MNKAQKGHRGSIVSLEITIENVKYNILPLLGGLKIAQPNTTYPKLIKLFITIFAMFVFTTTMQAQEAGETPAQESIFASQEIIEKLNNKPKPEDCKMQCRKVKDNSLYVTRIVNFDVITGTTTCDVYHKQGNQSIPLGNGESAGTINKNCQEVIKTELLKDNELWSYNLKVKMDSQMNVTFQKMTVSKFLAALMTLDPDVINFYQTARDGTLVLDDPNLMNSGKVVDTRFAGEYRDWLDKIPGFSTIFGIKGVSLGDIKPANTADTFNKANLGFFAAMYHNMGKIYSHLQTLLLVFIGSFFMISVAFRRGVKLLDKSNDDTGNKWLMTVITPALGIVFFFLPIPEDGINTNIVQKITRHFVQRSVEIADQTAQVGINAYMNKLFASVGAVAQDTERDARQNLDILQKQIKVVGEQLKLCEARYEGYGISSPWYSNEHRKTDNRKEFPNPADPKNANEIDNMEKNNWSNTTKDIRVIACYNLWDSYYKISYQINQLEPRVASMKDTLTDSIWEVNVFDLNRWDERPLRRNLNMIKNITENRLAELGWLQATIIAPWFIFIENMPMYERKNVENEQVKKNIGAVEKSIAKQGNGKDYIDDAIGLFMGQLVYFMLPGASKVYDFIDGKKPNDEDSKLESWGVKLFITLQNTDTVKYALMNLVCKSCSSVLYTAWIYEQLIKLLPIIFCVVAAVIATIGYLVELAKFFYIMPFVVAFSLTTKRVNKIFDFLLTGIAIFFKPILIVLFIFFALFAHSLVLDVFMSLLNEQFAAITAINEDMVLASVMNIFFVLLTIIASIGSMFIMWKLILTAPNWTLKMVGLDGNSDVFVDSLATKLERHSFQV
ncbi:MAG: hypothetical protein LBG67_02200 [Campylobacteraceae bacterium]|nr:hypothetical protein [Campylobacteraceae bacterium]